MIQKSENYKQTQHPVKKKVGSKGHSRNGSGSTMKPPPTPRGGVKTPNTPRGVETLIKQNYKQDEIASLYGIKRDTLKLMKTDSDNVTFRNDDALNPFERPN